MVFRAERSSQTEFISGVATGTEMVYWCGNTKGKVKAFTNHCGWQNPFFRRQDDFSEAQAAVHK